MKPQPTPTNPNPNPNPLASMDVPVNLVNINLDSLRFKKYPSRFLMLFIFAMGCVISPVLQLTYASVQDVVLKYYKYFITFPF